MSNGQPHSGQVDSAATALAEAFDELTSRLQAGQAISQEEVRRHCPSTLRNCCGYCPPWPPWATCRPRHELSATASAATGGRHGEHVPEVLGDFRLLGEIGRGGMGVVYEAEQVSLGRRVALKVLPLAATLDSRRLQRFHNEARAAAGLHHTNIVPVFAVGQASGVHFYAMQLIEGQSLAKVLRDLRAQTEGQEPAKPRMAGQGQPGEAKTAYLAPRESTVPQAALSTEGGVGNDEYIRAVAQPGSAGSGGAGLRPPAGGRSPGHQTRQLDGRRPGAALGHRLRPGPDPRRRSQPDPERRPDRHARGRSSAQGGKIPRRAVGSALRGGLAGRGRG